MKCWKETNYGWQNTRNKKLAITINHPFKNLYEARILKFNGVYSKPIKKKDTKSYKQAEKFAKDYMNKNDKC